MATQPGTGLAVFDPKAGAPAHVAQFFDDTDTNIALRQTVPSLSPEGKTWTIAINGEKTKLQRVNQDGDMEPLPIMKAVILDYAKQRGRAFYEGEYDPNNVSAPVCWSDDGVTPDSSIPVIAAGTPLEPGKSRRISDACATCPMAVKGSKVTPQGKAVTACSQHRMIAVTPDPALGLTTVPPLRLKIAMTSDWDKQSPDQEQQGWLAFSNYVDWLVARGVKHTAALVTKMKFDPDAAYPKIFFSAERYLDASELATITPLTKSPDVTKLLGGTWTPAGVDGVKKDAQLTSPQPDTAPAPATVEYRMADGETFTREQYHASGWTDEQLVAGGKMVIVAPKAPTPAPAPEPAPAPAQTASTLVVGEPAAVAGATTATDAAASQPAILVVDEPPSPAMAAPAAPPEQAPAQANAPAPQAQPAVAEPPAAASAAAQAAPAASTDVPSDVAELLKEWE